MNESNRGMTEGATKRGWHRSTHVFVGIAALVLLILNVPGQMVAGPDIFADGKYGPHFFVCEYCQHGWPWTYLRRESVALNGPPYLRLSHWRIFEGVEWFDASCLVANAAVCLTSAFVAGFLFETWRRQRKRLLQYRIVDLLVFGGTVAMCAAFYASHRSRHRYESKIVQTIDKNEDQYWDINERVEWQRGGPTWLRQHIADQTLSVFDRVVGIDMDGGEQLEHAVKLSSLRAVCIKGAVSNRELAMLEQLPNLEALDMCYARLKDQGSDVHDDHVAGRSFRLPSLPGLRGLNLYGTPFDGAGLENIPSIEVLDLSRTDVSDESIPALLTLTRLKKLSLYGTAMTQSGIRELRRALPECTIIDERWGKTGEAN